MSNFGKNIRYLRKLNNMSQDKLAEKLGYKSFTTIQKWESGNSEPSLKKLNQLSEIFNVDIDKLATNNLSEDKDKENMNSKNTKQIFNSNLNRLLNESNKTQLELAKYLGVSNTTVNNYVKGYNAPRMDKIDKIAQFFGVERSSLINEQNKNKKDNLHNEITDEETQILDPYSKLNKEGQKKAVNYTWDLVDSNKYVKTQPTREEMIAYLSDMEMAALDGKLNIHDMTYDELKSFYKLIKDEDE